MTYVINPWYFYWIEVVHELDGFFGVLAFITGTSILLGGVLSISCIERDLEEYCKKIIKFIKITFCIFIFSITAMVFIPSKTTLYQMIVAKNVTYENIEKTKQEGMKLVDYIIEKTEEYNKKKDGD